MKAFTLLACILAVLLGWFSLTWGQPVGEVDPHSIHKDGSSTTTAPIHFNKSIDIVAFDGCTWCSDPGLYPFLITFWPSEGPNAPDYSNYIGQLSSWEDYPVAGQDQLTLQAFTGKLFLKGAAGTDVVGGNAITEGTNPLRLYGNPAINVGSYGSDVRLQGGLSFGGGAYPERSGVVAILGNSDSIPSEVRGNYGFYAKGDVWVDGKITADDFIVAPPDQALIMRGGANEPVLVQMPTPTATPATATNPNDLFVEGVSELAGGSILQANAVTGYCAEFRSSAGVLGGYVLVDPAGSGALVIAPVAVADFTIGDFSSTALALTGTSVSVTAGTSFNAVADGGLMNVGRQSTPFVLKGKDAFDDEFSPIEAAPLHIYGGLANGVVDGAPVAIGPTGSTGTMLTGDYNLYVHGDTELRENLYLKGLTGPGMLKIDADELVAIATPATDYIATEVDPNAVLADGSRALSADWDAGSHEIRTKTIEVDDDTAGGTLAYFSGIGSKILNSANTWLHISGLGGIDDGTGISLPTADEAYGMWLAFANQSTAVHMGSSGNELVVNAGPYGEVEVGYGLKAAAGYTAVTASTCAAWDSNKTLVSGVLQPTPTPITTGNLTANSPITLSATRQVVGGAAAISHATTAGNKHVPTGGSTGQILRNTGVSGTAAWGTVTESKGALGAVTNITMTGTTQMNSDTSQLTQGAGRDVFIQYDGTNWLFDIAAATTEISFNDSSYDTNFRIEGNTDANLFFLDAGLDKIGIGVAAPTSKLDVSGDVELSSTGAVYFGDPSTNDSWRIVRSGNNLVFERRESGSWVTKSTMTP